MVSIIRQLNNNAQIQHIMKKFIALLALVAFTFAVQAGSDCGKCPSGKEKGDKAKTEGKCPAGGDKEKKDDKA